jgi:hypothetical protein
MSLAEAHRNPPSAAYQEVGDEIDEQTDENQQIPARSVPGQVAAEPISRSRCIALDASIRQLGSLSDDERITVTPGGVGIIQVAIPLDR